MRLIGTAVGLILLASCSTSGQSENASSSPIAKPSESSHRDESSMEKGGQANSVPPPAELGRQPSAGPRIPDPMLWLEPGDLLTSTGETPIRALLENGGRPVTPELLAELASQLELLEYPSLKVVPTSVTTYNPKPIVPTRDRAEKGATANAPPRQETRAVVELKPKMQLAKSWYVLALKTVPKGVQLSPWSAAKPPAGAYAARFHTGSQPILTRVLFCEKSDSKFRTILEFSENVTSESGFESSVRIQQKGKTCVYASSGPASQASSKWIDEDCAGFSTSASVHIHLAPDLQSSEKVPVQRFNGEQTADLDIELTTLPKESDGCAVWRP